MHFLVKLFLAAPASFFSLAIVSHALAELASHFFKNDVLAAPASFFSAAWAEQALSAANAAVEIDKVTRTASVPISLFMV